MGGCLGDFTRFLLLRCAFGPSADPKPVLGSAFTQNNQVALNCVASAAFAGRRRGSGARCETRGWHDPRAPDRDGLRPGLVHLRGRALLRLM